MNVAASFRSQPWTLLFEERLVGVREVELRAFASPNGQLWATVRSKRGRRPGFEVALSVRGPEFFAESSAGRRSFHFSKRPLTRLRALPCVLNELRIQAARKLRGDGEAGDPIEGAWRHKLNGRIEELAHWAIAQCDSAASLEATRYGVACRWFVYRALAQDSSGRLAQLSQVCPGALIFAWLLAKHGDTSASDALLEGATLGIKLPRLLGEAIAVWMGESWRPPTIGHDRGETCDQIALRQRQWIRKAAPGTNPSDLWEAAAPGIVMCDAPEDERARISWYSAMQTHTLHTRTRLVAPRRARAIVRYLSAQAVFVDPLSVTLEMSDQELIGDIVDYLTTTDVAIPPRSTPLEEIAELAVNWNYPYGADDASAPSPGSVGPFPAPPTLAMTIGSVTLDAISDPAALHKEGHDMRHCIYTRLEDILRGDSVVYQGHIGSRRVTVELVAEGDHYELVEARGICNASLNESERRALRKWMGALGAQK